MNKYITKKTFIIINVILIIIEIILIYFMINKLLTKDFIGPYINPIEYLRLKLLS